MGPAVTLFQDGELLKEGIDYRFGYDRTTNTIQLTPLSGIWRNDKVYVVHLNNHDRFVVDAPNGASITDAQTFTINDATRNVTTFEFESGYQLLVPAVIALQVPSGSSAVSDGQRFSINDGKRVATFEFDRNNAVAAGNIRVAFTPLMTQDDIAQAIVNAIRSAVANGSLVGLTPENLGSGLVHVGATPSTSVNVAGSSLIGSLTQKTPPSCR